MNLEQLSFSELVILLFVALELLIVAVALGAMVVVRNRAIRRESAFDAVKRVLGDLTSRMGRGADPALRSRALTVLATLTKDHARRLLTEMAEYAGVGRAQVFEELYAAAGLASEARANAAALPWERLRVIREARALSDPARLLSALVRDEAPDVRLGAFEALCALGRADEALIALSAIAGDCRLNRVRAIDALAAAQPLPEDELIGLAQTDQAELLQVVVATLGLARCRAGIDVIIGAVTDPDAEVRIQALKAVRELKDVSALPACLSALRDERWEVRSESARTCGALGQAGAAEPIAALLDDEAEWVRHNAALALTRCGPAGIAALRAAAARNNESASSALAEARLSVAEDVVPGGAMPPPIPQM